VGNGDDTRVELVGLPAEFRQALEDEIDAARRAASSSAVPLIDGRRIGRVGDSFQYAFRVESALNLPSDSPGDLFVLGRRPLDMVVLSIEGLSITLSVVEDLGDFVPRARLQSNLVHLMRRLIDRIESLAERENRAGDRALGLATVTGAPIRDSISASLVESLNPEQLAAVASGLGRDTTFIWGPPGTGKTKTIGSLGAELYRRGRSLLIVSHTNIAVDQALLHVADALGGTLTDGSVLRLGQPSDQRLGERERLMAETHIAERSAVLIERREQVQAELAVLSKQVIELQQLIDLAEWVDVAHGDLRRWSDDLQNLAVAETGAEQARASANDLAAKESDWIETERAATDALELVSERGDLGGQLADLDAQHATAEASLTEAQTRLSTEEEVLARSDGSGALMRRWRGLPPPEEQREVVARHQVLVDGAAGERDRLARAGDETRNQLAALEAQLAAFAQNHGGRPAEVAERAKAEQDRIDEVRERAENLTAAARKARGSLEKTLGDRLSILQELGISEARSGAAEETLEAIATALSLAEARTAGRDPQRMRAEVAELNTTISRLEAELETIEEALDAVEQTVISEATVVATTLTRAYLRDSIQARRFDSVVLDEASMAPIPALWAAAAVADRSVTLVGDHKQLPPIAQATTEAAERWLARDVFAVAGVVEEPRPQHFVSLRRQYRMHPQISSIANNLAYDGKLVDDDSTLDDGALGDWLDLAWGHDAPVLLVDTESTHAWVTTVAGRGSTSRLNFLSATVCVDLAERLLRKGRPELPLGERPRILVVSPYRPHSRLLGLLMNDQGIEREVVAGTVHTFQGTEADVVVLDLVNDEPHWRVGMFNPEWDAVTIRLLTVALTRPRRRLIVVGDFNYIRRNAKRATLGKLLSQLLERHPVVEATRILPEGLAGRAARAQSLLSGGPEPPNAERLVVTQESFFERLAADLGSATDQLVIYSPFMTSNRIAVLEPQLKSAAERGVRVFVLTKSHAERGARELAGYKALEATLSEWGITVIHKHHMHEKLVFIDDRVLWAGSLNPLSFSDTQEVMERRASPEVVADYAKTLRLADMLALYEAGQAKCPICGSELMPAEGRQDPFYWRCVQEDCHARRIDQPAPKDGKITCNNCGGAVEFGEWGGKPAWRCRKNKRHRQPVARTHLKLPKMRKLIPKRALTKLERDGGQ
jgi:hypothetical protein